MTNDDGWQTTKDALAVGSHVRCRVKEHRPFGVFTAIRDVPFDGLIQITEFRDAGPMSPREYPPIGSEVEAVVLGFKEHGRQIWLGVKPSQLSGEYDPRAGHAFREVISLGLRISDDAKLRFFGIDELNSRLKQGAVVVAAEDGRAIMLKAGDGDGTVRLRLGGFSVNIVIEGGEDSPGGTEIGSAVK